MGALEAALAFRTRGAVAAGAAEAVGARPLGNLGCPSGHAQQRFVQLPEQRTQAAPAVAGRRLRFIVDPAGLAIAAVQQADRLQALRIAVEIELEIELAVEMAHRGGVRQSEVGLAHQQAAVVKDERERVGIRPGRHQGREGSGRLEHGDKSCSLDRYHG
jgi:hypothetical protein